MTVRVRRHRPQRPTGKGFGMATKDVVIGISRNIDGDPMSDSRWRWFRLELRGVVGSLTSPSRNAAIRGVSEDDQWGSEDAYWLAATIDARNLGALRKKLALLARRFDQDAIALTVGATELVGGKG